MSITDITTAAKQEKAKTETISLSLSIPEVLYDKIKLDAIISKKPVGTAVEELADRLVSLQEVSIGLANLMKTPVREKVEPGVAMKSLTLQISRRHHNLIRLETLHQNTTISTLVRGWLQENTREWYVEPGDQNVWPEQAAA